MVARTLLPGAEPPQFKMSGTFALFMLVVFAPIVETLVMGAVLLFLTAVFRRELAVVLSALGWAAAHSAMAPTWGLVIWWPFLIFSILFVTWRQRSLAMAFAVPAAAHALQNSVPALVIAFGGAQT